VTFYAGESSASCGPGGFASAQKTFTAIDVASTGMNKSNAYLVIDLSTKMLLLHPKMYTIS
jgi:hypothetical protein